MPVTATPVLVQTPKIGVASWVNADGANAKKTIATAGANGSKVTGISVTSTDTSNRVAQLWLTRSATSYLLGSFTIPTLAGTDGVVPAVNCLKPYFLSLPVDNDGQPYLFLESGDTLQISTTVAVTATKQIDANCVYGNF